MGNSGGYEVDVQSLRQAAQDLDKAAEFATSAQVAAAGANLPVPPSDSGPVEEIGFVDVENSYRNFQVATTSTLKGLAEALHTASGGLGGVAESYQDAEDANSGKFEKN